MQEKFTCRWLGQEEVAPVVCRECSDGAFSADLATRKEPKDDKSVEVGDSIFQLCRFVAAQSISGYVREVVLVEK